jgi:hypothetical protein
MWQRSTRDASRSPGTSVQPAPPIERLSDCSRRRVLTFARNGVLAASIAEWRPHVKELHNRRNAKHRSRSKGRDRLRTVKTLAGSVAALFQPKLQEAEVAGLLDELQRNGVLVVNVTKVTYALPD